MKQKKRIGEMLIEAGLIDQIQLHAALGQQKQWGGKLGSTLIQMGIVDEIKVANVLEKQLGEKCITLENTEISTKALQAVKPDIAKKYNIMPINMEKNALTVAISDPTDVKTLDDLSFLLAVRIRPVLALESDIKGAIEEHYDGIPRRKAFKIATESTPEHMEVFRTEPEMESMPGERLLDPGKPVEKEEALSQRIVESLVSLLVEKGIITRDELAKKIKGLK